jgi:hypothetical protein
LVALVHIGNCMYSAVNNKLPLYINQPCIMSENLDNKDEALLWDNPQDNDSTTEEVYTAEQRKRHLQQLEWSRQESERKEALLVDTYKSLASKDASALHDLHEKDPKLADKVAKEFWYEDYRDLNKSLKWETSKWLSEDDLENWYQKRRAKDEHSEALKEAKSIISKLPVEVREKAQEYFDDISEWKTLTRDRANKFADMATLYVSRDKIKDEKYSNALADAMSTWVWNSKSNKSDKISAETKEFAKTLWWGRLAKYFD